MGLAGPCFFVFTGFLEISFAGYEDHPTHREFFTHISTPELVHSNNACIMGDVLTEPIVAVAAVQEIMTSGEERFTSYGKVQ